MFIIIRTNNCFLDKRYVSNSATILEKHCNALDMTISSGFNKRDIEVVELDDQLNILNRYELDPT